MSAHADVWAVVPIKATADAKQRLGHAVAPALRPRLALAMAEDVLGAIKKALGDEECACLDRVLQRTPAIVELARKCEDCGWDVSAARQTLEEQLSIATKAKATFFPDRS